MVEALAIPTTGRDLSLEAVDGLNEELGAIRGLFDESDVALNGLYRAEKLINKGLQKALIKGEVSEKHLGAADVLRASADELAGILGKRILLGAEATEFISMLDKFLVTGSDGTTLRGSLDPDDIDRQKKTKRYKGDDKKLPRLYVAGISGLPNYPRKTKGRVVSTMYQPDQAADEGDFPFGVWVWPNDVDEWTNASDGGTRFVDFLEDPKAKFVQHVNGAKLPRPKDYDPRYQFGMD